MQIAKWGVNTKTLSTSDESKTPIKTLLRQASKKYTYICI